MGDWWGGVLVGYKQDNHRQIQGKNNHSNMVD